MRTVLIIGFVVRAITILIFAFLCRGKIIHINELKMLNTTMFGAAGNLTDLLTRVLLPDGLLIPKRERGKGV